MKKTDRRIYIAFFVAFPLVAAVSGTHDFIRYHADKVAFVMHAMRVR